MPIMLLLLITIVVLIYCNSREGIMMYFIQKRPHFCGTVREVDTYSILVEVDESERFYLAGEKIRVSLETELREGYFRCKEGDEVEVYYDSIESSGEGTPEVLTTYAIRRL